VLALFVSCASLGGAVPAAAQAAQGGKPVVTLTTTLGVIEIEVDTEKAPVSAKNFLDYVDAGFFDGTIFHRVIPDFMIQGGGFGADMAQKPTKAPIKNEAANGLKNDRGTVAMARTNVVDSATAQFFINLKDNAFLNHTSPDPRGFGYAVFGRVTKGMDVVDKIAAVPTGQRGPHGDVPTTPVVIESAKRKK
jgi:peptidyl-prolyl cis-trans isomerase A (cyclophilin A)